MAMGYPIGEIININGVEFVIDETTIDGRFSVWCKTDKRTLVGRAGIQTCIKRMKQRAYKEDK